MNCLVRLYRNHGGTGSRYAPNRRPLRHNQRVDSGLEICFHGCWLAGYPVVVLCSSPGTGSSLKVTLQVWMPGRGGRKVTRNRAPPTISTLVGTLLPLGWCWTRISRLPSPAPPASTAGLVRWAGGPSKYQAAEPDLILQSLHAHDSGFKKRWSTKL